MNRQPISPTGIDIKSLPYAIRYVLKGRIRPCCSKVGGVGRGEPPSRDRQGGEGGEEHETSGAHGSGNAEAASVPAQPTGRQRWRG